ncbi:hypothetical protein [Castellaniella sp.]|uniref:hypothetical protein n=1 Tax=Castellaniella sp. TaxID=1955812 RepID=UPI002AFDFF07|nr:hypothetical protein [Castellaniella sp.]
MQDLYAQLQKPLNEYIQACEQWPVCWAEPLRLSATLQDPWGGNWLFQDLLSQWRQNPSGEWCRLLLQASHVVDSSNHYRFKSLMTAWVAHVAAHVQGRVLTTILMSPKGSVTFAPLDREDALAVWQAWWEAYFQGLCAPLPMEISAAGAWLRSGGRQADDLDGRAGQAAQEAYDYAVQNDPYLARSYPDFQALQASRQFYPLAGQLYGALNDSLPAKKPTKKATP